MQKIHQHIDNILPYGELIRGFANQSCISKGDLKHSLRERGIFFNLSERETMVPCLTTILLSPREFDNLRDRQNTREDNFKKSSSRIEWDSPKSLLETIPDIISLDEIIDPEYVNYKFVKRPEFIPVDNNPDKLICEFEIEREDLNKSWYEAKNTFIGSVLIEKISNNEVQLIKTYTSSETDEVANKLGNHYINHCKKNNYINKEKSLNKIVFGEFSNEHRIVFFWRLTSNIDNTSIKFIDILDMEFKPDENQSLPQEIQWMSKKKELIFKGDEIHKTFFLKDKKYYPFIKVWTVEAKFNFKYLNTPGSCTVNFGFPSFPTKGDNAEFEINIGNFNTNISVVTKTKHDIKQKILDIFEGQKNDIYKKIKLYIADNEVNKI